MYDLVDRPVARLAPGGRFLLWAMRGWIHSASKGHCPPGALAPAFAKHGALTALPHLHRVLSELNRNASGTISFLPLNACCIGEDEAVLLSLWRDAEINPPRARVTIDLLMEPEAASRAFVSLLAAAVQLTEAGLGEIAVAADGVTRD